MQLQSRFLINYQFQVKIVPLEIAICAKIASVTNVS